MLDAEWSGAVGVTNPIRRYGTTISVTLPLQTVMPIHRVENVTENHES